MVQRFGTIICHLGDLPLAGSSSGTRCGLGPHLLTKPVEQIVLDEDPPPTYLNARYCTGTHKAVEMGRAAVEQLGSARAVEGHYQPYGMR